MPQTKNKTQEKMTVSKYLVKRIAELGVDTIPVLTGGHIMKVIDEIGEHPRLRYICPNHEQALAMTVDAYARIRGFGVGLVTSGPGGTNLVTGIACAYYDSIPCMFISGQVGMIHVVGKRNVRQRGFQETNIVDIVKPITKYAAMITNPEDARYEFEKALYLAKEGRPGPVLLDLPYNVQRAEVRPENLRPFEKPEEKGNEAEEIEKAVRLVEENLKKSKRPVLLMGGGVRLSGRVREAERIVSLLRIPVVTTWAAADMFDAKNPLYGGSIGKLANPSANRIIEASDLVIALGSRFTTKVFRQEGKFGNETKVISVNIDRGELEEGILNPDWKVCVDLKTFLPNLEQKLRKGGKAESKERTAWRKAAEEMKKRQFEAHEGARRKGYINPYDFMEIFSQEIGKDGVIIPDCGCNLTWVLQGYRAKRGQFLFSAWGCSPMGFALPAGIGAYFAAPKRPIIVLIGDGGLQINIQEFQTIVNYNVPVKLFILDNECYGNIKFPARKEFGRTHATERATGYIHPNIPKVAKAYGIPAYELREIGKARSMLKKVLHTKGPVLVDVRIHPEQWLHEDIA